MQADGLLSCTKVLHDVVWQLRPEAARHLGRAHQLAAAAAAADAKSASEPALSELESPTEVCGF